MSAKVSDWLLDQVREVLAADESTNVTEQLPVLRSYLAMQRLLTAIVESADLERAT